jgi:hypothetical protein
MLLVQTFYLMSRPLIQALNKKDKIFAERLDDVSVIMLQFSHIIMNIGISLSIKKAFAAQVKKTRNKKLKKSASLNIQEGTAKVSDVGEGGILSKLAT